MNRQNLRPLLTTLHRGPETDRALLTRYLDGRDEAAFAGLVERHGPRVLAACRQVLDDPADVDDAFQATFLVLLNKARAMPWRAELGGWLFGVAHRVAVRARAGAAARRKHEARARTRPAADLTWREACTFLHEELDRLPDKFRLPLVLCHLDGLTRDEAARQLGRSAGAVKGQLERGRALLKKRLERRGVALSAGLFALMKATPAAAVPVRLVAATLRATLCHSGPAVALARGVIPSAVPGKLSVAAGLVLVAGLLAAGVASPAADAPPRSDAKSANKSAPAKFEPEEGAVAVHGRVLGPDGKPVAGAKLFVLDETGKSPAPQPVAGADGSFRFDLAAAPVGYSGRYVLAVAEGLGCDWAECSVRKRVPDEFTLRLPDDAPIAGRVIDLQGRPVKGAKVQVVALSTAPSGNLDEFLAAWEKEGDDSKKAFGILMDKRTYLTGWQNGFPPVETDAEGRFRLTGVGRDRVPVLRVGGPGWANQLVTVVTRPGFRPPLRPGRRSLAGPEPVVALAPSQPLFGTATDARTGKPLTGVRVTGQIAPAAAATVWTQAVETTTDAAGRYRLDGLPKADKRVVAFLPPEGSPHLHQFVEFVGAEGLTPTRLDVALRHGLVISGRLTDKVTGKPVRGRVFYEALRTNDFVDRTPGYEAPRDAPWVSPGDTLTDAAGRYRLTTVPGPGVIFVQAFDGTSLSRYTNPTFVQEGLQPGEFAAKIGIFLTRGRGGMWPEESLNAYRVIRPAGDVTELIADFALDPGKNVRGRFVDPDGKPLAGVVVVGLEPVGGSVAPLPGPDFTALAIGPGKPRRMIARHLERQLAVIVTVRGDEPEPLVVKLEPTAVVTGRALDADGKPVAGAEVTYDGKDLLLNARLSFRGVEIRTGADGRFRYPGIPAGAEFRLFVGDRVIDKLKLAPGEAKDLGDLKPR